MNRLEGDHRSMSLATFPPSLKVIVIQVEACETREQAWRRHLREHPEDQLAHIKIFHFERQEIS